MGKDRGPLSTVVLTDPDGEQREYVPFGERLSLFLKDFPVLDGWAVRHEANQAYPDRDPTFWRFSASLHNPEGRVVAEASALRRVLEYKDYEIGETAAFQRLLSYLGYPGDPALWEFEAEDAKASGANMQPARGTGGDTPQPEPVVPKGPQANPESDGDFPSPSAEAATAPPTETELSASVIETPEEPEQGQETEIPADVPSGFVRRIEILARKKGIKPSPYRNFAEAQAVLAQLQQ